MKRILFISHDASRTGAPIVLLNFIEWLKQQGQFDITIYLKNGGELEDSFKVLGATYLPQQKTISQRVKGRIFKSTDDGDALPSELLKQSFDLVYLNTVVSLNLARAVKAGFNCPVICHVHENDFTIKNYYPQFITDANLQAVDQFIAVSKSTGDNLVDNYAIDRTRISLVYEFVSLDKIKKPGVTTEVAKQELGIVDQFIIGGSGLTIWRKGVDLFMQLAVALNQLRPDNHIKLIWVGALTHEFSCQYAYEAERLGIADKVIFTGSKESPQNYFQVFDVFALTSREDPFPLVAIEAASLNKPIVCFEQSGGMPEFIKHGQNGYVVPYGDVQAMAIALLTLADDSDLRQKMGRQAGASIADFDISIAAPEILNIIEQVINH